MKQDKNNTLQEIVKYFTNSTLDFFDSLKDNKNTLTSNIKTNVLPSMKVQCNSPEVQHTTVVKLKPSIPTNNFSVCLFDEETSTKQKNDSISFLEDYNIIQVVISNYDNKLYLTVEDTFKHNGVPLERVLKRLFNHDNNGNFTLSIDLFNDKSDLVRTFIFDNVSVTDFTIANDFKLFNYDKKSSNTLKYQIELMYEEYNVY